MGEDREESRDAAAAVRGDPAEPMDRPMADRRDIVHARIFDMLGPFRGRGFALDRLLREGTACST